MIYASSVSPARTLGVVWPGTGFLPTLANPPAVVTWKAGNLLPAIFSLGGYRGLQVLAPGSPTSRPINCTTKAPTGAAQATSGVLIFVPIIDVYTYTWVTTKSLGRHVPPVRPRPGRRHDPQRVRAVRLVGTSASRIPGRPRREAAGYHRGPVRGGTPCRNAS